MSSAENSGREYVSTALGGMGGIGASRMMMDYLSSKGVSNKPDSEHEPHHAKIIKYLEDNSVGGGKTIDGVPTYQLKNKDGSYKSVILNTDPEHPHQIVDLNRVRKIGDPVLDQVFGGLYPQKDERAHLINSPSKDTNALLHELGHSAGIGRNDTLKHKLINANIAVKQRSLRLLDNSAINASRAAIPSVVAQMARRREGESEEDFLNRKQKYRHISNALGASIALPILAEEARASYNAVRLGKKMNIPVDKKQLAAAFGTYAAHGLSVPALRAALDVAFHKKDLERLNNRKANNAKES